MLPAIASQLERPIIIRPEYVDAVDGDFAVGRLLSQICYWCLPGEQGKSRLRIRKNGHFWAVKSRTEWMVETRLTLKQYTRAISILKKKGIVCVEQHLYQGKNLSHLRLLMNEKEILSLRKEPTQACPQGMPECALGEHSLTENTSETTDNGSGATGTTGKEIQIKTESESKKIGGEMKASEVLTSKSGGTGSLASFWQNRVSLICGGYQKALTQKEAGQLKQLQKALGDRTREVIDYALNNWLKFATRAGAEAGASFPSLPHIGFLLKYHAAAVHLIEEGKTVQSIAPIPVEPKVLYTSPEEKHVLTQNELDAMLAALKPNE